MPNTNEFIDITELGPGGLSGLMGLNRQQANKKSYPTYNRVSKNDIVAGQAKLQMETPITLYIGTPEIGTSSYDEDITYAAQLDDLNETRANLQPTLDKWGAGLAKMGTLAGTTFLNSTIGTVVGIGTALDKKEWNGLWNNEFNKAMNQINLGSEELFKNYYSAEEQQNPWYKNIGTANFWADGVLKNMGFTIGAIGAGALTGGALSSILNGVKGGKFITGVVSTLASATGEASIEALNTHDNTMKVGELFIDIDFKKQEQALQNKYMPAILALENTPDSFSYSRGADGLLVMHSNKEAQRQLLQQQYQQELSLIEQSTLDKKNALLQEALKAGNITMGLNQAVLSLSNAAQFGKTLMGGYANAKKGLALGFTNKVTGESITGAKEIAEGIAKQELQVQANKGFGKEVAKNIATNFISEGSEEGSQNIISNAAQINAAYGLNTFAGHKINPMVSDEVDGLITAGAQAIAEQYGSIDSPGWQEVMMGGIGGILGVPIFKKNSKGNIRPAWAGGVVEAYQEAKDKFASNEVVDQVNQSISNPNFINRYQGLVRRQSIQNVMDAALKDNNEFDYKAGESSQLVSDVLMFRKANQIDVLKSLFDTASNISDEDVQKLLKSFNVEGTNNNLRQGESLDLIKENIKENATKLSKLATNISKLHDYHLTKFGDKFNEEELEELTFLGSSIKHNEEAFSENIDKVKESLKQIVNTLPEDSETKTKLTELLSKNNSELYNTLLLEDDLLEQGGAIDKLLVNNRERYANTITELDTLNKQKQTLSSASVSTPVQLKRARKRLTSELEELDKLAKKLDTDFATIGNEDLYQNYTDARASVRMANVLQAKYDNYINNDGLLTSEINEDKNKVQDAQNQAEFDKIKLDLNTQQTPQDFKNFVSAEVELGNDNIDTIVETLAQEGNLIAKDYLELSKTLNSLLDTVEFLNTKDYIELVIMLNPNITNVDLLNEFISEIPELDNILKAIKLDLAKAQGITLKNVINTVIAKAPETTPSTNTVTVETNKITPASPVNNTIETTTVETPSATVEITPETNGFTPEYDAPLNNTDLSNLDNSNVVTNNKVNDTVPNTNDSDTKLFYTLAIHEYNINKRNLGIFEFNEIENPGFTYLLNFLRNIKGAFNFVNEGKLKPKELIYFIKDSEYIKQAPKGQEKYANDVIFMAVKRDDNYQIVGVLQSANAHTFKGLSQLRLAIQDGYNASDKTKPYIHPTTVKLNKIMPGYVKTTPTYNNLKDIVGNRFGDVKFAIMVNGKLNDGLGEEGVNNKIKTIDGEDYKDGRLYILIKAADGEYIPMLVKANRLNNTNGESLLKIPAFADLIKKVVTLLATSRTPGEIKAARNALNNILYVGNQHIDFVYPEGDDTKEPLGIKIRGDEVNINGTVVYFKEKDKVTPAVIDGISFTSSMKGAEPTIEKGQEFPIEQVEGELLQVLMNSNLYLQISTKNINTNLTANISYNEALIQSGVLSSNIESLDVVSGWFFTDYIDENGNNLTAKLYNETVSTPTKPKETNTNSVDVQIGNSKYKVEQSGTEIIIKNSNDVKVENLDLTKIKDIENLAKFKQVMKDSPEKMTPYSRVKNDNTYFVVPSTANNKLDDVYAYNANTGNRLNKVETLALLDDLKLKLALKPIELKVEITPEQTLSETIESLITPEVKPVEIVKSIVQLVKELEKIRDTELALLQSQSVNSVINLGETIGYGDDRLRIDTELEPTEAVVLLQKSNIPNIFYGTIINDQSNNRRLIGYKSDVMPKFFEFENSEENKKGIKLIKPAKIKIENDRMVVIEKGVVQFITTYEANDHSKILVKSKINISKIDEIKSKYSKLISDLKSQLKEEVKPVETKALELTIEEDDLDDLEALMSTGLTATSFVNTITNTPQVKLSKEDVINLVESNANITFAELPVEVLNLLSKKDATIEKTWQFKDKEEQLTNVKCLVI